MEPNAAVALSPVADAARAKLRADAADQAAPAYRLPVQIIARADVSRLHRESEALETFFATAAVQGATTKTMPQLSQQLSAFVNENKLNLLQPADRQALQNYFAGLLKSAPLVHVSFATEPRPDFLMKLVAWFRTEAHPSVLLQIGLQPSIAAGCIIRTNNKYFDFSFKKHFADGKTKLAAGIRGAAA